MVAHREMFAEDLLGYDLPGKRVELVRGRLLVRELSSFHHGELSLRLGVALTNHLVRERVREGWATTRGRLATADPGFTLARSPDTVRAPDVAYIARARLPEQLPSGFLELAPDLLIEVRSPNDRAGDLLAKVGDWLHAGTQLVWVVDASRGTVTVYRADGSVTVLDGAATLDGEHVLPGFTFSLGALFAP